VEDDFGVLVFGVGLLDEVQSLVKAAPDILALPVLEIKRQIFKPVSNAGLLPQIRMRSHCHKFVSRNSEIE
jgi:hypothetical protein